jgi:hypothetical protein
MRAAMRRALRGCRRHASPRGPATCAAACPQALAPVLIITTAPQARSSAMDATPPAAAATAPLRLVEVRQPGGRLPDGKAVRGRCLRGRQAHQAESHRNHRREDSFTHMRLLSQLAQTGGTPSRVVPIHVDVGRSLRLPFLERLIAAPFRRTPAASVCSARVDHTQTSTIPIVFDWRMFSFSESAPTPDEVRGRLRPERAPNAQMRASHAARIAASNCPKANGLTTRC